MRLSLIFILLLTSLHSFASEGDELIVTAHIVNLRDQAAENGKLLLKLAKDRRITEIQREGNWVKVSTGREDVPEGWLSLSYVQKYQVVEGVESLFDLFELAFDEFHQNLRVNSEMIYFSGVHQLKEGELQVVTTPSWFYRLEADRLEDMQTIFAMWEAVIGDEIPRSVSIVDENEALLMLLIK